MTASKRVEMKQRKRKGASVQRDPPGRQHAEGERRAEEYGRVEPKADSVCPKY